MGLFRHLWHQAHPHCKIHFGVRDKECESCGFKAINLTHLKRHIRARHTKEKSHICTYCGRAFAERYNMMSHIRTIHLKNKEEVFYKCVCCPMEYSEHLKFQLHMKQHHNIVENNN